MQGLEGLYELRDIRVIMVMSYELNELGVKKVRDIRIRVYKG